MTVTAEQWAQATSERGREAWIGLLTLTHPSLPGGVLRLATGGGRLSAEADEGPIYGVVSGENTFRYIAAKAARGVEAGAPTISLTIPAVAREQVRAAFRLTGTRATLLFEVVYRGSPDVVRHRWSGLKVTDVQLVRDQIRLSFTKDIGQAEPATGRRASPYTLPSIYDDLEGA